MCPLIGQLIISRIRSDWQMVKKEGSSHVQKAHPSIIIIFIEASPALRVAEDARAYPSYFGARW